MRNRLFLAIALAAGFVTAPAFAAQQPDIPFERFKLDNGLTVVVHTDRKAPIVAVNIWYHVGGKDGTGRPAGVRALFEHLMFQGSENYRDEFFKPVRASRRHRPERHHQQRPHQLLPERAHHRARPRAVDGVRPHGPPARRARPEGDSTSSAAWCRTKSASARTSPTASVWDRCSRRATRRAIPITRPTCRLGDDLNGRHRRGGQGLVRASTTARPTPSWCWPATSTWPPRRKRPRSTSRTSRPARR